MEEKRALHYSLLASAVGAYFFVVKDNDTRASSWMLAILGAMIVGNVLRPSEETPLDRVVMTVTGPVVKALEGEIQE